jgi:hypothetical protein
MPWFCESNPDLAFEEWASGVGVSEAARLLVVVDGVHRHPVLVSGSQITGGNA